ncbi:hypothetical protein TRAPUB_9492 [Trametes pubescens]|uniref:F-box domain-containing protein n=1 Tax=Trametes pubescens TaxID=154538 RepID=A0A1M2W2D8_TRAPU|nr:hypothetical protein TRAPUB_9492 [Trametes pubescens]
MHLCLHSPDVLRNICEQAYEGGYDPECRATVAALGATCRAIHRVAVKVLWSRLFSLRALVKCMPAELWAEDVQDDPDLKSTISLTRPPDPSEWDRFLANALLVTSFKRFGLVPDLDEDTYRTLCLYRPVQSLLPNLRELIWEEPDADVFEYGYQFLGPKLTTLHLGQPPSDSLILPILRSLHVKCPLLANLSVQCRSSIGPVDRVVSHSVANLHHLETVDLALPLFDDALLHLAALPGLSVAKIHLPRTPEVHDRLLATTSPIFPSITSLHISAVRLEPSVPHLIRLITSEQLSEVRLCTAHDSPATAVRDYLAALSACPSMNALSAVTISSPLPSSIPLMMSLNALPPLDRPEFVLDASVFEPLFVCSELTELEVSSFLLQPDDELLRLLANAFPRLQSLRLLPPYNAGSVSEATLAGLLPLLRHCPDLAHLAVLVDASGPLPDLEEPDYLPSPHPSQLVTLDVADSPIVYPDEAAAFLSAHCTHPEFSIRSAGLHDGDHDPEHTRLRGVHNAMWDQASRLVRLFVRVRNQERTRRTVYYDSDYDAGPAELPPLQLELS